MKQVIDRVISDAKVSERRVIVVPIKTIRMTSYNPPSRTKETHVLRSLMETIRRNGLAYPILITTDRDVVDGNRRLTACRLLGHETIECIVTDVDKDEAFSMVNSTQVRLGGKGWLCVARGGGRLPRVESVMYEELHGLIGNYGIDLLIEQNLGLNVLRLCKEVAAQGTAKRLDQIIMAVAIGKLTNRINAELRSDKPREEKVAAIDALIDGVVLK